MNAQGQGFEIVDAQIHLWQGDGAPPHHRQEPFGAEDAIAGMDAAGVDRAVNCPAIWDPTANDYAIEAAEAHPGRFATLAWIPVDGPPNTAGVNALLDRPSVLGLRFLAMTPEFTAGLAGEDLDWLWELAAIREIPVALMVFAEHLPHVGALADRFPSMRIVIDHLAVLPFLKLPEATEHLEELLALSRHPSIAVKASGVPSMATDGYPFASTHDALHRTFDRFGPDRMFWGTDITRMPCTWRACITAFTEELPWLTGTDLELVMGRGVRNWLRWT